MVWIIGAVVAVIFSGWLTWYAAWDIRIGGFMRRKYNEYRMGFGYREHKRDR